VIPYATYVLPAVIALAVLFLFPLTRHIADARDRHAYYVVQAFTFAGALLGAKLIVLVGDHGWPFRPLPGGFRQAMSSGRSIIGGLLGGLAFGEASKPLIGYRLPPNDRFAAVLPFSIAIGRVGCHLTGCCLGLPHHGVLSVTYADGVPRYPSQLFEVAFQLAIGIVFIALVRRRLLFGRLFSVYLVAYGTFRFGTEFLRDTPKWLGGISAYQAFCVPMVLIGAAMATWRTIHPPAMPPPRVAPLATAR
jgi:phosphatidylglycerol:prolipoprotein diacylglycerol transferase